MKHRRALVDTAALVAQLAVVGAMAGSLVAFPATARNGFLAVGAAVGASVGWGASRDLTKAGLFAWVVVVGAALGLLLFAPLAIRLHDPALYASGASLGVFLAVPAYLLALPAFAARGRSMRARDGSVQRGVDALATWAGSSLSIVLLGMAGQPSILLGRHAVDLSAATLALAALVSGAVLGFDRRAPRSSDATGASAPQDVGIGGDTFEERVPASSPFRAVEKVTAVTVGSARLGRQALGRSIAGDAARLVLCVGALVWRASSCAR